MGDHPRRPLRPRRVAVRAGSGWAARPAADADRGVRRQEVEAEQQALPRFLTPDTLRPVQELGRIERRRALADLEMQLRRVDIAGLSGARDHLPALDLVAALDQQL